MFLRQTVLKDTRYPHSVPRSGESTSLRRNLRIRVSKAVREDLEGVELGFLDFDSFRFANAITVSSPGMQAYLSCIMPILSGRCSSSLTLYLNRFLKLGLPWFSLS